MNENVGFWIKRVALVARVLSLLLLPADALGWTSARLTRVDVVAEVAPSGESRVETAARFEVSGGEFSDLFFTEFLVQ